MLIKNVLILLLSTAGAFSLAAYEAVAQVQPALSSASEQLLNAALTGNLVEIEDAIAQGAFLEARDSRLDLTPLMLAIYRDHPEAIRLLIQKKAFVNARNPRGQTPLMMLASGGQAELVRFLLDSKADLNLTDELGNTALMWAAYWGHQQVIETLLTSVSQDKNTLRLKNEDGNTVLHLAALGGVAHQTRRLLQKPEYAANGRRLPTVFKGMGHLSLMKRLAGAGADINAVNHLGQTPLMLMAEKGFWEPTKWLLDSGANTLVKDAMKQSLFDYAQRSKSTAFVRRLKNYLQAIEPS